MQGTDSCVGGYTSGDCSYHYDYGGFAGPLSAYKNEAGYAVTTTEVDRSSATLTTFGPTKGGGYRVGLHVPRIASGRASLSMDAACRTLAGRELARQVLGTITFP